MTSTLLRWLAIAGIIFLQTPISVANQVTDVPVSVEQWDFFEIKLTGPATGNPFTEVSLSAQFVQGDRKLDVPGFYDGDGIYRIRFMPDTIGEWQYETHSNRVELQGRHAAILVKPARAGNHGPVSVRNTFHFAYADGTPYRQIGTTSYSWLHHNQALEEQTLKTLATSPFNKLRMVVFPMQQNNPDLYPFAGRPPLAWDLSRFNPAFFRHIETGIDQLRTLGIEADIILFHPYDKGHFGFDRMPASVDDRYLRYVVARLSAYRNVWWSMANEFDFMTAKTTADWDRYFHIVQQSDPYQHLRSIHNGLQLYNQTQPWVTHASIQSGAVAEDARRAVILRDVYRKPVVLDEVKYEGNMQQRWGHLTPEAMLLRFWQATIAGTYAGHSDTYLDPEDGLPWLDKGGVFRGQSVPRIAFLRSVLATAPAEGLDPIDEGASLPFVGKRGSYYLTYFGRATPLNWKFLLYQSGLREGMRCKVEIIDTWNMTIHPVDEYFELKKQDDDSFIDKHGRSIALPGKPYVALRITVLTTQQQ
ncbi:DUF5060 domain-containing protein [Undibacterium sp. Di26W]|uniref:DUF5060 domain-containing protein n=1 Tax=Undibacterium sp. Di26W TaxID=3413035 RepID=UPI003BF2C6A6